MSNTNQPTMSNTNQLSKLKQLASISHHWPLMGFKNEGEALSEIRRMTSEYWDFSEFHRLVDSRGTSPAPATEATPTIAEASPVSGRLDKGKRLIVREAADLLQVPEHIIYGAVSRKELVFSQRCKAGRILIWEEDLLDWARSRNLV